MIPLLAMGALLVPQGPLLTVGDPAPDIAFERWLSGTPIERLELGTVYVLEFWTAWCPPCMAAMPHLAELQRVHGDEGLKVVLIAPRPDEWGHDLEAIEAVAGRADMSGVSP